MKNTKKKILSTCLAISLMTSFNPISANNDIPENLEQENIELDISDNQQDQTIDMGVCYAPAILDEVEDCEDCLSISNIFDSDPTDNITSNFKNAFDILVQSDFGSMVFENAKSNEVPLVYDQELIETHKNADGLLNISNGSYIYNKDSLLEFLEEDELTNFVDTIAHEFFHAHQLNQSTNIMKNYRGMDQKEAISMAIGIEIPAYMFATIVIHDLVQKDLLSKFDVMESDSNIVRNLYKIYDKISKNNENGDLNVNIALFADKMLSSDDPWISFFRLDLMKTAIEDNVSSELKEDLASNLPENADSCLREFSRMANGDYLLPKSTNVDKINELLQKDMILEQIYYGDIYIAPELEELSTPSLEVEEEGAGITIESSSDIVIEKKDNIKDKEETIPNNVIKKLRNLVR